jgi:glyoxylase-like metal-dependent hydrolase (beta-lactamase superfamily II)
VANLRRKDISLADITYLLITHYHPDHAGLAQAAKANCGTIDADMARVGAKSLTKESLDDQSARIT